MGLVMAGTPAELFDNLLALYPTAMDALDDAAHIRGEMTPWQNVALYGLAHRHARAGGRLLEIGSFLGHSAALLALAAPNADVTTLNPCEREAEATRHNLALFPNVSVLCIASWDYLRWEHDACDVIFVDGDHKRIARDLPWFNRLAEGGLILFHDYDAVPAHYPVFEAVNSMAQRLGRALDVRLMDTNGRGLAGFIRQRGETWSA